jgi:hypothetical protein
MKILKLLLPLALISFSAFGQGTYPKYEVGFFIGFWESTYNSNGSRHSEGFFAFDGGLSLSEYPYSLLETGEAFRSQKDDYSFTMPSFKVFIRRNFEGFYLSSGLNFLQDDIGYQMPANLPNPNVLGHYMRVRTNAVEIPLIIGHRLEFFEYLRVFAGVSPTFSFNSNPSISSVYESNFSEQENRDATQAIQEFQSALIDSFSPFYINGTVGVGFDYKIVSIEFQLDRTLTSLSKNERAIIGQTAIVFDERRTRKTLQVGLKIPLKK